MDARTIIVISASVETREIQQYDFGAACSPAPGLLGEEPLTDSMAESMVLLAVQQFLHQVIAGIEVVYPVLVKFGDEVLMVQE